MGLTKKALKLFNLALLVNNVPKDEKAFILSQKALIHFRYFDIRDATKIFDKAIEESDNYTNIYNYKYKSEIYVKIRNYKKAFELKKKSRKLATRELNKFTSKQNYSKNNIYSRLKDTIHAIDTELGYIAYLNKDYFTAKNYYQLESSYQNSSSLYLKMGKLYQSLLRKNFNNPQTKISNGKVIFSKLMEEQHAYALGNYLEALKLNKNNDRERVLIYRELAYLSLILHSNEETFDYIAKAEKIIKEKKMNNHIYLQTLSYSKYILFTRQKKYDLAYENIKKVFNLLIKQRNMSLSQLPYTLQREKLKEETSRLIDLFDSFKNYSFHNKDEFFNLWLKYKGEISNAQAYLASLKSKTTDSLTLNIINDLEKKGKKQSHLYFLKSDLKEDFKEDNELQLLNSQIADLEEQLSSKVYDFKTLLKLKKITSLKISQKLSENEIYLDFAKVGSQYYLFTLDKKQNITFNIREVAR